MSIVYDAPVPALHETPIRENVWVWTLGGDGVADSYGANCVGVAGRDGVLLVDPLIAPAHARLVEAALAKRTNAPVRFVVLSHHHSDHALGSTWFAQRGATVIAHEECGRAMATEHPPLIAARRGDPSLAELFADAEPGSPGLTYSDALTIDLRGGTRARIVHPGHGHTLGDSIVFLPRESVAICGDLVSNGYHVNFEDASPAGAVDALDVLSSLGAETHVPGHGPVGGPDILENQKWYYAAVREAIGEGTAAGHGEPEIVATVKKLFPGFLLEAVLPETVRRLATRRA
jgi:cyclase